MRTVTKEYQVPDTKITLAKDVLTIIPVYGIHHDPKYYPNPEKFLPERFEPHEISQRPSCTFIPFGDGPRNCIGNIMTNFDFEKCILCNNLTNFFRLAIWNATSTHRPDNTLKKL